MRQYGHVEPLLINSTTSISMAPPVSVLIAIQGPDTLHTYW